MRTIGQFLSSDDSGRQPSERLLYFDRCQWPEESERLVSVQSGRWRHMARTPGIDPLLAVGAKIMPSGPATRAADQHRSTGFSGTLVRNKADPSELVLALRATEFIDDAARDNDATNKLEANDVSVAFGQLADRETWYAQLKSDPSCFRARTSPSPATASVANSPPPSGSSTPAAPSRRSPSTVPVAARSATAVWRTATRSFR